MQLKSVIKRSSFIAEASEWIQKKKKRLLRIWTLTFMHTNTAGRFKIKRNKKKKGTGYIWKLVFKAVEYLHIHFVIAKDKRKVKHCRRAFCCWSKNACSFAVCVSHILRSLQWLILLQWDWPIECSNVILCAVDMKREKNELKLKKKKMLAIKGKKVNKEKWKKKLVRLDREIFSLGIRLKWIKVKWQKRQLNYDHHNAWNRIFKKITHQKQSYSIQIKNFCEQCASNLKYFKELFLNENTQKKIIQN